VQDPVGQGCENQVGFLGGDARPDGFFGIERAQPNIHQGVGPDNMRRRALDHGDVDIVFPKRCADVVGRIVRPDDNSFLPAIGIRARMLR